MDNKIILLAIPLIALIFISGCIEGTSESTTKGKAMLKVKSMGHYINIDDETEMWFEYNIYNFGDIEARDIEIICNLYDEKYDLLTSITDYFGNIASNSVEYGYSVAPNIMDEEKAYVSLCYIKSCDDCEKLYKKIPELVELYEGG